MDKIWWMNLREANDNLKCCKTQEEMKSFGDEGMYERVMRNEKKWPKNALWSDLLEAYADPFEAYVGLNRSWVDTFNTCVETYWNILKNSENYFRVPTYTKHESTHDVQKVKNMKHEVSGQLWKIRIETCMNSS